MDMRKVSSKDATPPLRALVIGADPANVTAMAMLLQKRGHDVALLLDLTDAAARLGRETFDCVIFECRSRDEMDKIHDLLDSAEMADHRDRCAIIATNMQGFALTEAETRSGQVHPGPVTGNVVDRLLLATGFGPTDPPDPGAKATRKHGPH